MKSGTIALLLLILLLLLGALPALAQTERPPMRVLRTGGLQVETAALLMSGQEGGTIPVAPLVVPQPGTGEKSKVSILLELDGAEILEGQTGDLLRLDICLYAVVTGATTGATAGRVAGARMDTVEIDLARLGADIERSGVKYVGELELPPGEYALRLLVRNPATGEVGLRAVPLTVPDFRQRQGLALSPLLPEPAGAWLVARGAGITSSPSFSLDALPSARPILAPSGPSSKEVLFRLPAWKLGEGELRVEVRRPGGARVATFPVRVSGREATSIPGLEILAASFEPKDLEEGVYDLRVVGGVSGSDGMPVTPFVLLAKGGGGQVWAALTPSRRSHAEAGTGGATSAIPARQAPPARAKRVRSLDAKPVQAAYRKALSRLAGGDREGARDEVREMERTVLMGEKPASSEDLQEVELAVAKELSRGNPEALIPILALHQVIYRDAVRAHTFLLSTHSRELIFQLTGLYASAERSPDMNMKKRAAGFLTALAAEMIWTAPPSMRSRLFQRILDLDGTEETALLCLAVDAERQGRYSEAVAALERLTRAHPGNTEARLRLAVNLARLGKVQDARKLLTEISGGKVDPARPTEPWLLAVAWQEIGRLLIGSGNLDQAETVLRAGLQRLPDDEKIALQLALIRDLRKDPRGAREAVSGLGTKPGSTSAMGSLGAKGASTDSSPRHRYNRLPFERLEQAWSDLQKSALDHIPTLAVALGLPEGAEPPRNTP